MPRDAAVAALKLHSSPAAQCWGGKDGADLIGGGAGKPLREAVFEPRPGGENKPRVATGCGLGSRGTMHGWVLGAWSGLACPQSICPCPRTDCSHVPELISIMAQNPPPPDQDPPLNPVPVPAPVLDLRIYLDSGDLESTCFLSPKMNMN